ncbi:glycoside-pentoside-hexuronide (GPH):cation symporter [Pseudoalteromonas fenneropenaei]|uniref:Glycoside-pentoside-hexuronide (GPH):cation symporter n=1 Tax=Pseudoalteromonas fenneropenaei TaxID=1737459 RepID=A0ABV7CNP8_9GAMM
MITIKEKIAYGLGDTASNIIFQSVMMFLMLYYTDIMGLNPAVVGTMFLVVRVLDAITDPLMGALADNTRTKYGQFRPYLLWLALPFAIVSVLAFTVPDLSPANKVIYAYVTYGLLMLAYTAINIPYCALAGVLSNDPSERVSIQSFRFVFGMLGGLIVASLTLPLTEWFGQGDAAKGYQLAMLAMSTLGFVLFILCFLGTKERVASPEKQGFNLKQFKVLLANDQWRVLCAAALFLLSGQVLRLTLAVYYVKYFLGREDLVSLFITLGVLGSMFGCAVAQPLAARFCKVKLYIGLQFSAAVLCALSYFIPASEVVLAFAAFIVWKFLTDAATPLLWAKMADTIDYGEAISGVRTTGLVYSSVIFFIKLGIAIGGALAGWFLAYFDYQSGAVQTTDTIHGIVLTFTLLSSIGSLLVAWVMRYYRLNNKKLEEIQSTLTFKGEPHALT